MDSAETLTCAQCGRPIPADVPQSLHHLVPRSEGGKKGPTMLLHHMCHKVILASCTEVELARQSSTVESLRSHPRLSRFVDWVTKRPPGFLSCSPKPGRR